MSKQVDLKKSGIRIFFGIPAYGGNLMAGFVRSYLAIQRAGLIHHVCHVDGDSLVSRARNRLTAEFLRSDCTHLLFIDTDIVFDAGQVAKLIARAESGLPIVAGLYPKKQRELAWVINTMEGEKTDPETGLRRVKYAGTGFMLISRDVFRRIQVAHPELAYKTDNGELEKDRGYETFYDYWRVGVHRRPDQDVNEPGRYLSEDWYFCQMLEDLGIPVMMDMTIHTKHIGQVAYPLEEVPMQDSEGNPVNEAGKEAQGRPEEAHGGDLEEDPGSDPVAEMEIPNSMTDHIRKIWLGEYEFEIPVGIRRVLDIGANCGGFTKWIRKRIPGVEVYAYEPVPENFALLERNCRDEYDVHLRNLAVVPWGDEEDPKCKRTMFKGKNNPGEYSLFDLGEQDLGETILVNTMPPSDLPSADLVKIDTEGSEVDILKGMNLEGVRAIILEWHREEDHQWIKIYLEEIGFLNVRDDKRSRKRGILAFVRKTNPPSQVKGDPDGVKGRS